MIRKFKSLKYIILLLISFVVISSAHSKDIKVVIDGTTEKIESFDENEITYFSFSEFAEIVGGILDWNIIGHQISYIEDTNRFKFILNSPYISCNDSLFNLVFPALLQNGKLFLPAETFIPLFNQINYQKIIWDKKNRTIRVNSEYFNITDISFTEKANGLLIELFLTSAMAYDVFITEGNWINISVRNGIINSPRIESRRNPRFMYELKTHQQQENGQVSIRLRRKIDKWHHKIQTDPPRLQISIADVNFQLTDNEKPAEIGPDNKIDVIVIDAGHGGDHYGAIGQKKTREKDIALDMAKELAKLIRKDKQFKVIMTRDRDKTVTLEERAKVANDASCDLFISIHANSSPKKHIRGWNVFFLAQARNDSARAVAQFENSAFLRDNVYNDDPSDNDIDPILGILSEMIMTEFQVESHDFAMMVDREFRRNLNIPARGIDQAGFFVLNRVYAPSVLLETGFISNVQEEKLLKNKKYRKKIARSVYDAIKRFKAKYESN
jgi:N-acetylmuramoyl-L-alanine amidase